MIGRRAVSDADRFDFFMREVDCLESAREFDQAPRCCAASCRTRRRRRRRCPGSCRPRARTTFGRLTMRMGTVQLLAGKFDAAIAEYRKVLTDYPKTAIAAEAQYRIAYGCEAVADDFERAQQEYAPVKDQFGMSNYNAAGRRRARTTSRGSCSTARAAPARTRSRRRPRPASSPPSVSCSSSTSPSALEEYARVVADYPKTAAAGRAAQRAGTGAAPQARSSGRRGLAQLARDPRVPRDRGADRRARLPPRPPGQTVPDSLIKFPVPKAPERDTTADAPDARARFTPVPANTPPLGFGPGAMSREDSLAWQHTRAYGARARRQHDDARMRNLYPNDPRFGPGIPACSATRSAARSIRTRRATTCLRACRSPASCRRTPRPRGNAVERCRREARAPHVVAGHRARARTTRLRRRLPLARPRRAVVVPASRRGPVRAAAARVALARAAAAPG